MSTNFQRLPNSYDWTTIIVCAIILAVIVGILFTTSFFHNNLYYRIFAYLLCVVLAALLIFGVIDSIITIPRVPNVPPAISESQDPFTYDPGESANGVIVFAGNAASLPVQFNCQLKSNHTVYENAQCNCAIGYYGRMCEYSGFDDNYVSLTTNTTYSTVAMPSLTTPTLSSWPTLTTMTGCTNVCTSNPQCLGVTYANTTCTMYSSLSFPSAPIQDTGIDPPVLDSTLYLNKSRLLSVDFQGYFNVIFGPLPLRYFIGNQVSSGTSANIHVTSGGSRVGYYPIGVQSTFSGIPDFVIVGTSGTLYISPLQIPERSLIPPGGLPSLTVLHGPFILTRQYFPYSEAQASYHVRLDAP